MKTEFKIFKGSYDSLEEDIKKYQEKHKVEIKSIVLIDSCSRTIIGVIFKRSSKFEKIQRAIYRSEIWE